MEKYKIILLTQARIGSTRFPRKILEKIENQSLLEIHLQRLKKCKSVSEIIVATTTEDGVELIQTIAQNQKVGVFQGSTNDVLDRFYQSVKNLNPDYVVRVTSDCPLIDSGLIDEVVNMTINNKLDYGSNTLIELFPDGQDVEVISWNALKKAWEDATLLSEREHVTPFVRKNADFNNGTLFKAKNYPSSFNYNNVRMTVDEPKDLEAIKILIHKLGLSCDWKTYADYIIENAGQFENQTILRNEGYIASINKEKK